MAASRRPTGANHQKNRYFEKIYEEAVSTGEIKLNGRKLIDYPKIFQKGDLLDTVKCDISDNMYTEVPKKILEYTYLEELDASHNNIRIEKLPFEMASMNIECINLNFNPLKQPPADIAKKGWKHIVKSLNRERKRELGEETRRNKGQFRHSSSFPTISSLSQQSQISSLSLPECVPVTQRKPELVRRSSSSARPQPPPRTVSQLSSSRSSSVSGLTTPETSPDSTPKNSPNMQNGHRNFTYSFHDDSKSSSNSASSIPSYKADLQTSPSVNRRSVAYSSSANVHQISPVKNYSPENNNGFHTQMLSKDQTPSPNQDRKPSNFTIQRHEKQAVLRQSELYRTRRMMEEHLKCKLPENITAALRDGVILCHLANQIWPHSIDRVHVPSVVDTELPTAKCQKNVNSFLTACRRIGVSEDFICPASVILEEKEPLELCRTVQKLLDLQTTAKASAV
ncbi:DgyrCDS4194 [Dimorphilus gyrociliatus]|uniref:DgyrCDS4194 n=1 Tax=Dimorphilus gyrociliatus TaxID=2664684 RepID=A0A7I8VG91_9ANNE|nr:DgyrCDS4194 [Dimorphilus gyrociliatus]